MKRSILPAVAGAVCALAIPAAAADSPCMDCHDDVAAAMANQVHMRIEPFEVSGRTFSDNRSVGGQRDLFRFHVSDRPADRGD